ncbi:DNA cytosine methyltransferase [Alphaproteobacteria bacterium]|nr:DNA cytosine methyltransferase [Alphaproteobacteria bacterium]
MTGNMQNVLDLFCGCGGLSLGFEKAGFKVVAGIDNDAEALQTYATNFPKSQALNLDLNDFGQSELDKIGNIDLILGGPPCQGFSIAGKRNADDPRNRLTRSYIDVVDALQPKALLIENVPNILNMANGSFREEIMINLKKLGYNVFIEKLSANEFGVPQNRKRVFFIGLKKGDLWPIEIEKLQQENSVTCFDALEDLPTLENYLGDERQQYRFSPKNDYQRLMRKNSLYVSNHIAVDHKEKTKEIIALVPDGGNYKDLPKELQGTRKVNIAWTRMNSKKPCFTIDAGHNHHFHYQQNRVPTVRECARIQSFPDNFYFLGKRTSQYRQVGNAVPPLLTEKLAYLLKNKLT